MPRTTTKRAKTKMPKASAVEEPAPDGMEAVATATAVAEPSSDELQPPTTPVETSEDPQPVARSEQRDHIAASLNIAKLQAMSMNELNAMARDLGVENFGTMRKHEVIFHVLQKNAERAGVLFSEGVLEVLPE